MSITSSTDASTVLSHLEGFPKFNCANFYVHQKFANECSNKMHFKLNDFLD